MNSNMNKTSAGKFLIDLTPLLDVVLILLVAVLYLNPANADGESNNEQYSETQEVFDETDVSSSIETVDYEGEYNAVLVQNQNYKEIDQYVNVITVYASYTESYRWNRKIYVVINNGDPEPFDLNPQNESTIWDEVKTYIEQNVPDAQLPTVISIDNTNISDAGKMLYRDEQSLLHLYEELNFDIKCTGYNTELYGDT